MTATQVYTAGQKAGSQVYMLWGALIWVIGLVPAAETLIRARAGFSNSYQAFFTDYSVHQGGIERWVSLGALLLTIGIGVTSLLLGLVARESRLPKTGLGLWLGAMILAFGHLLSSRFGAQPDLSLVLFGLPIVFTAVYLLPPVSLNWFVRQAGKVLLFYAYGSLLAALVAPQWAVEYPYTAGLIPGFDVRLHGLVTHTNNLAPLLLTYLVLSWFFPSKTRWDHLHQVVVLLALILTQSKTVWILLVVAYLIRLAYATWVLPSSQRYSVLALLGAIVVGGIMYLVAGPAWLDSVEVMLSGEQFTTLTGRTLIWQITLNLWEQNPWFGYGPSLWDTQMRLAYAPTVGYMPTDAHNQVYQTLGEAGIVGVAGLLLYATMLLVYGARYARATNGAALTLVMIMLLRGITESVLLWGAKFFVHFLVFAFLILASRWKSTL